MRIQLLRFDIALSCMLIACFGGLSQADETEQAVDSIQSITASIDQKLFTKMEDQGVKPASRADDAEFLRRIWLDLAGGIPSVSQTRDFLESNDPNKRPQLVESLLTSPATINHLAETWRKAMLPAGSDPQQFGNSQGLHNWLRKQFSDNMRYDRIVSDLIASTGTEDNGPALFYTALELEPKKIAAATARIFLGLQLECAECHDHPFDDWKQEEFWGYAAFFARLPENDGMMQNAAIRLTDRSQGEVTLPESEDVVPPKYPRGRDADPAESGTRRQQLSIWMASPDNPFLARAAVNRVWAMLFGRGLVDPVDDLGPHNPASHPELLEELTNYFIDTRYDLRNLLRVLCNTEAYGRTSQVDAASIPPADLFSAMAIKVQTAEQLYDSLSRCLSQDQNMYDQPFGVPVNAGRQQFLTKMASRTADGTEYDRGLQQALMLMNGNETSAATNLASSSLLQSLEAPFLSDEQRINTLYLATLTRHPTKAERQRIEEFIQTAGTTAEEKKTARADVLWALLNSAEFTMNR